MRARERTRITACWIALTVVVLMTAPARAGDTWPAWRGGDGVGIADDENVTTEHHVLWEYDFPGLGHSSPIVWKNALFLTTCDEDKRLLIHLDAKTGKEVWSKSVLSTPREGKHKKNSFASSTPATDGERVFVSFLDKKRVFIAAYDFDGKEIWRKSPGEFHSRHGFCSSPILFENLVILNCDQDAYAYLVAFERKTGKRVWKTHRENEVRSYCPPTIFDVDGKPQMILSGSKTVASFSPRTGKRIWVCDGPTEQCVASLVYGKGLVFVTGGFPDRWFLAIDPRGKGDVTKTHLRWKDRKAVSYVPSPLYLDGHFYCVSDVGVLSSLESTTGKYVKQQRLRGNHSASLLYASGHIYAFSERGHVTVLKAGPELEIVSTWQMDDPIYATPAVAHRTMYLRTWERLYALGTRPTSKSASSTTSSR
jgi:outer membrane protein assembly factor BamB